MKTTLTLVMALLFAVTVNGQTGAFASDCPTLAQQQAAYNQSKANSIVVINTSTQQLQCYYQQLATHWNQVHKTEQQDAKTVQQLAKDKQQLEADSRQVAKEKAQVERDAYLVKWELELKAREAIIKENEEECKDIRVFCNELKLIIENPDCNDKKLSDHCKLRVNHSGQADGTNPGGTTNNNGGILNPHN